jgi:hypothetical protein
MTITTREELKEYALRRLGKPVIQVNVEDSQAEDRIDEALEFYQDFHYDGTERVYLKHQITGSSVGVVSVTGFLSGETVISATGASFIIDSIDIVGKKLITKAVYRNNINNGTFLPNEVITGQSSGAITTVIKKITGDIENRCVTVSDLVTGVIRAIPWQQSNTGSSYFDPKYQAIMATFQNLASSGLIYYSQLMSHLSLMDQVLRPIDSLRFNKKLSKIYIDQDWSVLNIGGFIIFECYRILDPEVIYKVYNDRLLKMLVTAKIKYQWASNCQVYAGIQLLGGVTIDASTLMAQAAAEIIAAEQEIRNSFSELPIGFLS